MPNGKSRKADMRRKAVAAFTVRSPLRGCFCAKRTQRLVVQLPKMVEPQPHSPAAQLPLTVSAASFSAVPSAPTSLAGLRSATIPSPSPLPQHSFNSFTPSIGRSSVWLFLPFVITPCLLSLASPCLQRGMPVHASLLCAASVALLRAGYKR